MRRLIPALAVIGIVTAPSLGASKPPKSAVPASPDDRTILHVLNRTGFGARPGDIERVRQRGLANYLDDQLHPERIADPHVDARLASLETLNKSPRDIAEQYYVPAMQLRQQLQLAAKSNAAPDAPPERTPAMMEAQRKQRLVMEDLASQKILRAAYSDRQLEEVMTDFWFNHFNVFAGKGATQIYLTQYERDVIRPHALGKFRDLLGATASSPAMLFYLDNWQSADPNSPDPRAQARAQAQQNGGFFGGLFGRRAPRPLPPPAARPGAQARAQAARPRRGLNENYGRELMELHTLGVDGGYTQKDVVEVARAFTGWTIANPRQGGAFRFEPRMHDDGRKVVLGHVIKPGGGMKDGEQVLDILASHPSAARFISTKLVRRFVSDTPPPALVDRAAARFRDTHGDIREVLRTILTSPEFFSADAYRAKMKSPFEFVVSSVRATGVDITNPLPLVQTLRQLGEPLYQCQPPTGYGDVAETWVNTGTLLNRMNFALALISGRMPGVTLPAAANADPRTAAQQIQTSLVTSALANTLSPSTEATLAKAVDPRQAVALTLGSPEFQRR